MVLYIGMVYNIPADKAIIFMVLRESLSQNIAYMLCSAHVTRLCEELNNLFEALTDGRVKIEPKVQ
jgi:hypothetical protein